MAWHNVTSTSWYITAHHGTSWYIMVYHGTSWYITAHHSTASYAGHHTTWPIPRCHPLSPLHRRAPGGVPGSRGLTGPAAVSAARGELGGSQGLSLGNNKHPGGSSCCSDRLRITMPGPGSADEPARHRHHRARPWPWSIPGPQRPTGHRGRWRIPEPAPAAASRDAATKGSGASVPGTARKGPGSGVTACEGSPAVPSAPSQRLHRIQAPGSQAGTSPWTFPPQHVALRSRGLATTTFHTSLRGGVWELRGPCGSIGGHRGLQGPWRVTAAAASLRLPFTFQHRRQLSPPPAPLNIDAAPRHLQTPPAPQRRDRTEQKVLGGNHVPEPSVPPHPLEGARLNWGYGDPSKVPTHTQGSQQEQLGAGFTPLILIAGEDSPLITGVALSPSQERGAQSRG